MDIELEALRHALHAPAEPSQVLADAVSRRWVGPSGDARVLQYCPSTGGPWTEEPLGERSRIMPRG